MVRQSAVYKYRRKKHSEISFLRRHALAYSPRASAIHLINLYSKRAEAARLRLAIFLFLSVFISVLYTPRKLARSPNGPGICLEYLFIYKPTFFFNLRSLRGKPHYDLRKRSAT